MSLFTGWKNQAARLKNELLALYLAYRDPRVPWYAKAFLLVVLGYALCPIDLIPDFIPVLGYLDDLILIPAGIYLALKMIPRGLMTECREKAKTQRINSRAKWVIAAVIVLFWLVVLALLGRFVWQVFFRN